MRAKKIIDIRHPEYAEMAAKWQEYRLVYKGGDDFLDEYLISYSKRESQTEFSKRKRVTNIPAIAKAVLTEIKNSIFERITDVRRVGGPVNYTSAVLGLNSGLGVDLQGNTMNSLIGRVIIPDLLVTAKIGVFIDKKPVGPSATLRDTRKLSPYMYPYAAEDILSWARDPETNKLTALLLRDHLDTTDEATGLTMGKEIRYRLCRVIDGITTIQWYDSKSKITEETVIELDEIPFVTMSLTNSLLTDISSYQKALLNVGSSDLGYIMTGNLPFYTEQYDPSTDLTNILRRKMADDAMGDPDTNGSSANATASDPEATVGATQGRRYPRNLERPSFIHPSTEPLLGSMKKQEALKQEIRELVNLNISSLMPSRASAESKKEDSKSLEAGLSYIGMELQYGENEIARIWSRYESSEPARVAYPKRYSIRSDKETREEASDFSDLAKESPSITYQRAVAKHVVTLTVGDKVTDDELQQMHDEIDKAAVVVCDPDIIKQHVDLGILSRETAAKASNYPDGEVKKANEEHAARAVRILDAQTNAADRGVDDISAENADANNKLAKEGTNDGATKL